jgi:hypothetical protein
MADEKQLNAVRFFCKHPSSNSGSKKSKADYPNWGDLVQQISYFDFGHIQKDLAIVQTVDRIIRKEYPKGKDWIQTVSGPGVDERILSIIRTALTSAGAA